MKIIHDKFFILCIISCLVLLSFCVVYQEDEKTKEVITGIIIKCNESEKGFVFDIEDTQGLSIHCFCKEEPILNNVCSIEGSYSDDKLMFFVSKMYFYGS